MITILNFIIKLPISRSGRRLEWEQSPVVVCLCKGVSDKKIRWLVQNGASSLREVMQSCQAGSDCGACVCQVREIIEQTRNEDEAAGPVPSKPASSL
jgi:bacterioferritin-associated ferredoxin